MPPSGFDAFELLHVLEPLVVASGRFQRSTGWALGPVVRYRHDHSEVRDWQRSSGEYELRDSLIYSYPTVDSYHRGSESDDAALAGARLEWHRPMGLRSQVDLEAEAFFDVRGPEHETNSSARLSLGHLVGERWFAFAEVRHLRELTDLYSQKWSRWEVASTAGLRYYLEDRWDIGVQCSHCQYHDDHASSAHLRYFNRSGGIDLSIGQQVLVIVLCVFSAIGAAGIPGGALPLIMTVMAQVGVPPDGIALVLGVDRLLDIGRTGSLTSMKAGLQYRMRPCRSVVDTKARPRGNGYSVCVTGRLLRIGNDYEEPAWAPAYRCALNPRTRIRYPIFDQFGT